MIFFGANRSLDYTVSGLYIGCYLLKALLRSDLRCFYDQSCLYTLQSYINWTTPINVTNLNPLLSSQYSTHVFYYD
jgi:hypothetical protein